MRYIVKSYLEKSMRGLMECLETNDWSEVEEFIWSKCQQGLNCIFIDNEDVNNCGVAYADLFTEDVTDVKELIVHEHGTVTRRK